MVGVGAILRANVNLPPLGSVCHDGVKVRVVKHHHLSKEVVIDVGKLVRVFTIVRTRVGAAAALICLDDWVKVLNPAGRVLNLHSRLEQHGVVAVQANIS